MLYKIKILLHSILPKHSLTNLLGWCADLKGGWITNVFIKIFIYIYKIDMSEAKYIDISDYATFNEFFTRPLRDNIRPIEVDPSALVMPVDGIISQFGIIKEEKLFQAKGYYYNLDALLAGNTSMINQFRNGSFINIYLTPKNYHRVHMPCNGTLREMIYIPGKLFSVSPLIVANIANLFTRNERIICLFDTDFGPMVQILVGSIIVGSIETIWYGVVNKIRSNVIKHWYYPKTDTINSVFILKGSEMGYFKLGSTVINLFSSKNVSLSNHLYTNYITKVGQLMAHGVT